jgi:hypothetical protein
VKNTGGDEELFADRWPQDLPADFELDVALEYHHDFIDAVCIALPGLSGRISPDIAPETTGVPFGPNRVEIDHAAVLSGGLLKRGFA